MENSGYNVNASCKYDENGVRTQKIVNDTTTDFVTSGITLLAQKTGENVLTWQIDGNGNTVGFNYNGTEYFYLNNTRGDIIGITDTSGNIIAEYVYDSWGKLISITDAEGSDVTENPEHIGYINPLRYRGYYYDQETGLYYLNARYYDPETGRFINADSTLSGGLNLFAYCYNNPVNLFDPSGCNPMIPVVIGPMTTPEGTIFNYNCYGYAIQGVTKRWEDINPSGYTLGDSVEKLAYATICAINSNGANGILLGTLSDTQLNGTVNNLSDNEYLIAMRVNDTFGQYDYHFIRLNSNDKTWMHKPGRTGWLQKLNGISPNNEEA